MKQTLKKMLTWSFPVAERDVGEYGKRERNAFLIAMFGQNIIYNVVGSYLSVYYTSVIFVPAVALLIITVISRVWDAINDIMMGTVADRTKSRWGKFRPYLKYAPVAIMILTIFMFMPVRDFSDALKIIFVIITWLSWETAYTLGDIPLWGMTSVITPDETKRSKLISAARVVGSISAIIVLVFDPLVNLFAQLNIGLFPQTVDRIGDFSYYSMQQGYLFAVVMISLLGGLLFKMAFPFVRERVVAEDTKRDADFAEGFKHNLKFMWQNKPYMITLLSSILGCTKGLVLSAGIYFCWWALANGGDYTIWLVIIGGSFLLPTLAAMHFSTAIAKKLGKKRVLIMSSYLCAIPYTIIFFIYYFMGVNTLSIALSAVMFAVSGFLTGFSSVYLTTMIADCTDFMEWKTGKRLDGVYFSGLNFLSKLQSAITLAITYAVYAIVNYTDTIKNLTAQIEQGVINSATFNFVETYPKIFAALLLMITLIPAAGNILQAIPLHWYELDEKKNAAILADLEIRRAAAHSND